jgi:hypothetical protein
VSPLAASSAAFLLLLASAGPTACGGDASTRGAGALDAAAGSSPGDASDSDASVDAGDHGSVSTTYPAFAVDMPKVVANQGTVLKSPVIVTITWPAEDPNASSWDAFGDAIGASGYWRATTSEYGAGAATSGPANHVHMVKRLPTTMSYYELQNFVLASLGGSPPDAGAAPDAGAMPDAETPEGGLDAGEGGAAADPEWPVPPGAAAGDEIQVVYGLFVPASTSVTDPGSGTSFCNIGGLGYHDNVSVGGKLMSYSVTLECPSQTLAEQQESAAHEYVEAATNPYPESTTRLGYSGFDSNHLGWALYTGPFGNELADVCQSWSDSYYQESAGFPYWVQRSWSNVHAAAGNAPCVPVPATPYHGMTLFPSQQSALSIDLSAAGAGKVVTRGYSARVGESVTFQAGFYSDGDAAPWTIGYDFPPTIGLFDTTGHPIGNGTASVTIDKTSGQNGEKAYVTVTPKTAGRLGFQVMAITWDAPVRKQPGFLPHFQPIIVSNR